MKLFATLYLDEDVDLLMAKLLSARRLDVTTARDEAMLGRSDEEQVAHATSLGRCILTFNRTDFERLHAGYVATGPTHSGILIATQRHNVYHTAQRVAALLDSLTADEIEGQLLYV
ncbi:MAG TPA: DUF5615 family PIN-like protein [Ardenticatenaceae bacterium]|jgi:hypothetical protein